MAASARASFDADQPDFDVRFDRAWSGEIMIEGKIPSSPLTAVPHPDGGMLVVQQNGVITLVTRQTDGESETSVWGDLTSLIENLPEWSFGPAFADERGLLGLALHPQFGQEGSSYAKVYFVVYTTGTSEEGMDHTLVLARMDHASGVVVPSALLLQISEPEPNHQGGSLVFGPAKEDARNGIGYLYMSVGDGGGAGDSHGELIDLEVPNSFLGNAQNVASLLGKILRIDVNYDLIGHTLFSVPTSNTLKSLVYAFGVRNVWGLSFDTEGRLWGADVGQDTFERVIIVKNGANYGWRAIEGGTAESFSSKNVFSPQVLARSGGVSEFELAVISYDRSGTFPRAVIGGFVYRGSDLPALRGKYVFGDYRGDVFYATAVNGTWEMHTLIGPVGDRRLHGIAETADGELWFMFADDQAHTRFSVFQLANNGLTMAEIDRLHDLVGESAASTESAMRTGEASASPPEMFSAVVTRDGFESERRTSREAWIGSRDIARGKAFTALGFSSDGNALTSRTIGVLSQPGGALWRISESNPQRGIIAFPGGVPLYKNGADGRARLVGGLGVSGDVVDVDEAVAWSASKLYHPPEKIMNHPFVAATESPKDEIACSANGCDGAGSFACNKCRVAFYCSKACQTTHWVIHAQVCNPQ